MAKKKEIPPSMGLTIDFNFPDYIITRFATNMTIQTIENEFKISFFELKPAMILSEEDIEKIRKQGTARADCIGSFIITPDRLPKFIQVLNEHLSKYNKRQEK